MCLAVSGNSVAVTAGYASVEPVPSTVLSLRALCCLSWALPDATGVLTIHIGLVGGCDVRFVYVSLSLHLCDNMHCSFTV